MNKEQVDKIMLVGKYMGVKNLFPLHYRGDNECMGVYIAEDEEGSIDYVDVGINWYSPQSDWNTLMPICKKIIESYYDKREDIFEGLHKIDIDKTFNAVVEFIKFWNDESQLKIKWNK